MKIGKKGAGMNKTQSKKFKKTRWLCLTAGILIEALAGFCYAWSVVQTPLVEKYGWSISAAAAGYTIYFISGMVFSVLFGSALKKRLTARQEVILGAILYGGGIAALRFMTGSIWFLYLSFGLVASMGTVMIYPVLVAYALELFPDKTGLASGVMTAGYGLGAVIWAPLLVFLNRRVGDIAMTLFYMGAMFLTGILMLSPLIQTPPEDFREMLREDMRANASNESMKKKAKRKQEPIYDLDQSQMMKTPMFYWAMIVLIAGMASGGMVVTQGSPMVQMKLGITAAEAATVVSLLAVANTAGRIVCGVVSDRLGKTRTVGLLHAVTLAVMAALITRRGTMFVAAMMGAVFCYGGFACQVAPVTEELFGGKHIGANYSVTYLSIGLASLFGPQIVGFIRDYFGNYELGYLFGAVMAGVGILVSVQIIRMMKKVQSQNAGTSSEI